MNRAWVRTWTRLHSIFALGFLSLIAFATMLSAQKVETVDGVRVVHNSKGGRWGKNPQVSLQLVRTLGEVETTDENLAFHMPADVAVDAAGNIYVLDSGNHRIQKFSADGRYLATLGRKGQGPAEFQFPSSLEIDANRYLYVSDANNQRLQVLTPEGKDHRIIKMVGTPVGNIVRLNSGELAMAGSGGFMIMFGEEEEKAKALPRMIKILDSEGKTVREFGSQRDFKDMLLNRMGNQAQFAVDGNDNIYIGFEFQNRIEKYSPEGQLLWRADRGLNYSMDPPKDKGRRESSGGRVTIQMPEMNRCANGVAADSQGRVWVVTLSRQIREEEKVNTEVRVTMTGGERSMSYKPVGNLELQKTDMYKLEVYDSDGVLLGEIPLDHFVDGIFISGDRLFLLDKMRGAKFYEYRIIE
ncbi:MAG: NHL repeat-containing protein [Acidobacteriota bacterium]